MAGGAGTEMTGVGGWVGGVVAGDCAGVGAVVGMVALDPVLAFECAGCVVDVTGRVVEGPDAVVDVAAGATAALAGMPLFSTANHAPSTFCPCA